MTATAEPNLDHPLVEIACRLLQPDATEKWRFDDEAASLLERAILSQKTDPGLPGAVLGLFHVATDLQQAQGATMAAGRLFAVLGAVGPQLFNDGSAPEELYDLIERAQESLGARGNRTLPLPLGAQAPEGTIPARDLARDPVRPRGKK